MKLPYKQIISGPLEYVLVSGNTTNGTGISVSNGDYLEFLGAAQAATTGTLRIAQGFTLSGRDVANSNNRTLIDWSSDDLTIGHTSHDITVTGLTGTFSGSTSATLSSGGGSTVSGTTSVDISSGGTITISGPTTNIDSGTVIIKNLTWPNADGQDGYAIITDGAGNLSFGPVGGSGGQETLSETLAFGDTTSGQHITISNGDYIEFIGASQAATTGTLRIAQGFTLSGRDVANSNNRTLIDWSSDDLTIGNANHDTTVIGLTGTFSGSTAVTLSTGGTATVSGSSAVDISSGGTITISGPTVNLDAGTVIIKNLTWPSSDGQDGYVMTTDGAGNLSFEQANTGVTDHGLLTGLSDDDHTQYVLAELSSTDNRLVRWDSTSGRAIQTSAVSLDDSGNMSSITSVAFGSTPATTGTIRGTNSFNITVKDLVSTNITMLNWASNDLTICNSLYDLILNGLTITLKGLKWPGADGSNGYVMTTDGAGTLSLVDPLTLSVGDHGNLSGLGDDDHIYMLPSTFITDNHVPRWDGSSGRQLQGSGVVIDDSDNVTGVVALTATGTIQGERLNISSTIPGIYFLEQAGGATSPPADESIWKLLTDGGDLYFQTRSDADVAGETALKLERTGTSVTGFLIGADTTNFQGNDITNVDDLTLSSTGPSINIIETDVSTDGGWWRWGTGNDDLVLTLRDDAGAYIEDAVAYRRTGGALDYVEFPTAYVVTNRTDQEGVANVSWSAGSVFNYSLGSTVTQVRATPTGYVLLTGITGGVQGRCVRLSNVATSTDAIVVIKGQNTGSSAANRIITHGDQDYFLQAGESVLLIYDSTTSRWRLFSTDGFHPQHYGFSFQTTTASNTNLLQIHATQGYQYFGTVWLYSQDETSGGGPLAQWQKHEFCFGFPDSYTGVSDPIDNHEVLNGPASETILATIGYSSSGSPSNLFTVYLTPNATPLNLRHTWKLELRIMTAAGYA